MTAKIRCVRIVEGAVVEWADHETLPAGGEWKKWLPPLIITPGDYALEVVEQGDDWATIRAAAE
jgi:hypothetical protein